MSKKDLAKMTEAELRETLAAEREESARRQEAYERQEAEREAARKAEETRRNSLQDDRNKTNSEPTEEQWTALESKYEMTRDEIKKHWKLVNAANAGIAAELQGYRLKEAATEATAAAKNKAAKSDPQFPKYSDLVDEYLSDVPLQERADPAKMEKHMDRAINYARGKARATKRPGIDQDQIRDSGSGNDNKETDGFGYMEVAGIPLQINVEKRVDDDFRKAHSHPEREGAVLMNERKRWNDQVPKKPR